MTTNQESFEDFLTRLVLEGGNDLYEALKDMSAEELLAVLREREVRA